MTETAYFGSAAQKDSFMELGGVQQYEILATLDFKTSKITKAVLLDDTDGCLIPWEVLRDVDGFDRQMQEYGLNAKIW